MTADRLDLVFSNFKVVGEAPGVQNFESMIYFIRNNSNNVSGVDGAIYEATFAKRILRGETLSSYGTLKRVDTDGDEGLKKIDTLTDEFAIQCKTRKVGELDVTNFNGGDLPPLNRSRSEVGLSVNLFFLKNRPPNRFRIAPHKALIHNRPRV